AVDDDDSSIGNTAHHRGRSLEQMRILIRIVEDADDLGVTTANPLGDAAIDVFGCDDLDGSGGWRRMGKGEAQKQTYDEPGSLHGGSFGNARNGGNVIL